MIIINFFLVAILGFGLGRLTSVGDKRLPIKIEIASTTLTTSLESTESTRQEGKFVGSKNGTKYHYPWCSGAARIKEENKIWFATAEEARRAGYTPAANCPGL